MVPVFSAGALFFQIVALLIFMVVFSWKPASILGSLALPARLLGPISQPEATQVLNGYFGGRYMMAGRDLVVVDQHTRRVAAIISGVGN
jgi:hypothetical protein